MVRNKWMILATVALTVILLGIFSTQNHLILSALGSEAVSPEDEQAILETLTQEYRVEAEALYTLDGSHLAEVYINDPRARKADEESMKLIRFMRQDYSLSADDVGLLDFRQAVIAWYKYAIEKREAIEAQMAEDGRDQMTDEEAASLTDETGRVAVFGRAPDPETIKFDTVTIKSIVLNGDMATVDADIPAYSYRVLLIKVAGHWYIAETTITEDHF